MEPAAAVERSLPAFSAVRPGDWSALEAAVRAAGVPARLAAEVIAFVPIAFGRALLDGMGVEFSPEYALPGAAPGRTGAGSRTTRSTPRRRRARRRCWTAGKAARRSWTPPSGAPSSQR
jgi:hypothetical protein